MFKPMRDNPLRALIVIGIPALVMAVYLAVGIAETQAQNDGYVGGTLDDTWIHVRFADSISRGDGLMYNDGVVTSGATSPLWVMTLGAIFRVTSPDITEQVHIAVMSSAAGAIFSVMAISGFGWFVTRRAWVGLLAGVLTALTGRFLWMGLSGMEITTFTGLLVMALWSHVDDLREGRTFGWRTGIVTALATLARPEAYLLAVLIGLDAFVISPLVNRRNKADVWRGRNDGAPHTTSPMRIWWARVRGGWRGIVAYVLLAGSYPLATLMIDGHLLPNTFRVKSSLGKEAPDLIYGYFWTPRVDHGWLMIALAAVGIAWLLWSAWTGRDRRDNLTTGFAFPLWPVAFVIAVLYLGPQHFVVNHGRYVAPAIPFHALLAAVGIWRIAEWITTRYADTAPVPRPGWIVGGLLAVMAGFFAYTNGDDNPALVANDVGQLRRMHVSLGGWLVANTQPDDVIALNDVGAAVHISDREVLDLVGLVSPESIDAVGNAPRETCEHDMGLARLMLERQPRYVAVFPWWYPCMTNNDLDGIDGMLQPETLFEITGPTVIAGGIMVVYTPVWDEWPLAAALPDDLIVVNARFDGGVTLHGATVDDVEDDAWTVTIWWGADAQPLDDYTAFLHLIDADGNMLGQSDSRPRRGTLNTQWWQAGDIVPDTRIITPNDDADLSDTVALRVGLYTTDGQLPLSRLDAPPDQMTFVVMPLDETQAD